MTGRLLSVTEAARYLGVSYNTMADYLRTRLVPTVELPARTEDGGNRGKSRRNRLVDCRDLDALIDERKTVAKVGAKAGAGNAVPSGQSRGSSELGWYRKQR